MVCVVLEMDPFPMQNFIELCIALVENIGSLHYANLPNADTSHYMI